MRGPREPVGRIVDRVSGTTDARGTRGYHVVVLIVTALALTGTMAPSVALDAPAGGSADAAASLQAGSLLEIVANGEGEYRYEFVVEGSVQKAETSEQVQAEENDEIQENDDGTVTVTGTTGNPGYGDAYRIEGEIVDYRVLLDGTPVTLRLDGETVSASDLVSDGGDQAGGDGDDQQSDGDGQQTTTVEGDGATLVEIVSTSDGGIDYEMEVRGSVEKAEVSQDIRSEGNDQIRSVDDDTVVVEGHTGNPGYGDAYRVDGEILDFRRVSGDAEVTIRVDGEEVAIDDLGGATTPTDTPTDTPDESDSSALDEEPTFEYDMVMSDQLVEWWLERGAKGVRIIDDGTRALLLDPGTLPDVPDAPEHRPGGDFQWEFPRTDAPMGYDPPANFEWEPLANRSYEFGMSISDSAVRERLADDPVRGLQMVWMCPTDAPDCAYADQDAGITFFVTDSAYAESAPNTIEGQPIQYRVIGSDGDDSSTYTRNETEAAEPGPGPTNRFDMSLTDQWVDWWLANGATGVLSNGDGPAIIQEGHRAPEPPTHDPGGEDWDGEPWHTVLHDGPMDYVPPENFEWEPQPDKSYEYDMAISDGAVRDVLTDDPVDGVSMAWMCPNDNPDCEPENEDAGMVFSVTSESYAQSAPETIEGQPVRYSAQ